MHFTFFCQFTTTSGNVLIVNSFFEVPAPSKASSSCILNHYETLTLYTLFVLSPDLIYVIVFIYVKINAGWSFGDDPKYLAEGKGKYLVLPRTYSVKRTIYFPRVLLFDLAHKQYSSTIKGWLHCLTSGQNEDFLPIIY